MAKQFRLRWVFEGLEDQPGFFTKRMFGGLAVYVRGRMVLVLTESEGERRWQEREYPFDIWHGLLLPTDRSHHESLVNQFRVLFPHPVLGKWLYLPISSEDFEGMALNLVERIAAGDARFGIEPNPKAAKKNKPKNKLRKKTKKTKAKRTSNKKKIRGTRAKSLVGV